jgi:glycosyltransferase involved in cell wall biosynthesis
MKKVSVILTTYNGEKTIENTIISILNQDSIDNAFKLELIVVDDCSTDNTPDILNKFDIILLNTSKNSGGPNKGRNIGLLNATGDYICIADQDDIWESHKIISLLPYLEKVPIVTSGFTLIDISTNKKIIRTNKHNEKSIYYEKNKTFISKLTKSIDGQQTYLGSIIFVRELKNVLFEETFGMIDFDWVLRLFHGKESIEVCDSLYTRIVDGQNLSLNKLYRKNDFYYSLMFIETYMDDYPKEVRTANLKIHGSRARYYYLIGEMKNARMYFLRSKITWKTVLYYITTFFGSSFVKKHFNIFG